MLRGLSLLKAEGVVSFNSCVIVQNTTESDENYGSNRNWQKSHFPITHYHC